jgi:hypothetical protein
VWLLLLLLPFVSFLLLTRSLEGEGGESTLPSFPLNLSGSSERVSAESKVSGGGSSGEEREKESRGRSVWGVSRLCSKINWARTEPRALEGNLGAKLVRKSCRVREGRGRERWDVQREGRERERRREEGAVELSWFGGRGGRRTEGGPTRM